MCGGCATLLRMAKGKTEPKPFKGQTVLIVEDEPLFIDMYSVALSRLGFDVISAADGDSGLAEVVASKPSLVLLDMLLPGKSGLEVLGDLKSNPETKDIPVIICTALSSEEDKQRGLSLGAHCFLTKSGSTPKEVAAQVESCLRG